ncbi:hypothetical protein [Nocardia abscessus]|uniref:hypothetical protein n=1 Tax=Nocardia abscessus TaxID=120957 RepID=UPI0012F7E758|nr:hypothetical protein [Nocardia abscessus]
MTVLDVLELQKLEIPEQWLEADNLRSTLSHNECGTQGTSYISWHGCIVPS